ncbi:MAG: hypothetical protein LBN95_09145 [Prevotellaceae bacterium]|jgi:hypothetical protein|nr:hypothetical protein [Prevotellaceae bacterium]
MCKNIHKSTASATCSAMERETISKNRVSPKNVKSRRNLLQLLLFFAILFLARTTNAQTLDGTTWSYTERIYGREDVSQVTSYFAFTSPTKVIWYLGTPKNFVFPVGFGTYDANNGTITFSHTNPLHKNIYFYSENGENTIIFNFRIESGQATMRFRCKDTELNDFFNDGQPFKANKEKYSLKPNSKLVGTWWSYTYRDNEKGTMYFKSVNEVIIDGRLSPYVCIGNSISIKSGDNIEDENLTGIYNSEGFELCRDGILDLSDYHSCITIEKIQ